MILSVFCGPEVRQAVRPVSNNSMTVVKNGKRDGIFIFTPFLLCIVVYGFPGEKHFPRAIRRAIALEQSNLIDFCALSLIEGFSFEARCSA